PDGKTQVTIEYDGDRPVRLDTVVVSSQHAADKIAELYFKHKDDVYQGPKDEAPDELPGSLQLVFADLGTPSKDALKQGKWTVYDGLFMELAARGVPTDGIRFMQEAQSDRDKAALFRDARNGKISVLIGSTETMGTGTNVQRRAIAVHHLDCPWRPVDLHQRTGRVVRQKNLNYDLQREVHVYNYVTENSFDAYVWQLVLGKAKFIQQLMSGKLTDRTIEDIAMDLNEYMVEAVAMGAGDPRLQEVGLLQNEILGMEAEKHAHNAAQYGLRHTIDTETLRAEQLEASISWLTTILGDATTPGTRRSTRDTDFSMTVVGRTGTKRTYAKRKDAAAALHFRLIDALDELRGQRNHPPLEIAELGGVPIFARLDFLDLKLNFGAGKDIVVDRKKLTDDPASVSGTIQSLERRLAHLEDDLATAQQQHARALAEVANAQQYLGTVYHDDDNLIEAKAKLAALMAELETEAPVQSNGPAGGVPSYAGGVENGAVMARSGGGGGGGGRSRSSSPSGSGGTGASADGPTGPDEEQEDFPHYTDRLGTLIAERLMAEALRAVIESHPDAVNSPGARKLTKALTQLHEESRSLRAKRLAGEVLAPATAIVPPDLWRTAIDDATKALGRNNPMATDLKRLGRLAALHEQRWTATLTTSQALAQWEDSAEPRPDQSGAEDGREYVRLDDLGLSAKYTVGTESLAAHALLRRLMQDSPILHAVSSEGRQLTARRRDSSRLEAVSNDARLTGLARRSTPPTPEAVENPTENPVAEDSAEAAPTRTPTSTPPSATPPAPTRKPTPAPAAPQPPAAVPPPAPVPVFTTQKEWDQAFAQVDAAEIALSAAANQIWDREAVPHAFNQLRRELFAAVAAHEDRDGHDTEAALTKSLMQAERLLRSLKGRDRATMQAPLNHFTGLTRTFLDRHRATLNHLASENDLTRSIEARARAQFEEEMNTWSQNNQPLIQAIRDGDDDTVRTLAAADPTANGTPATQTATPTPALAPTGELAGEAGQDTATSDEAIPQDRWILGEDRPAPYATDNEHDSAARAREALHSLHDQWQEDFGRDLPAEPGEELATSIAEFTDSWDQAHQTPAADWGLQLQAYTRAQVAAETLAGQLHAAPTDRRATADQATGRLRHLARTAALHVDRLAHTPPPAPDGTWLRETAHRFKKPYANAAEVQQALDALAEAAAQPTAPNGLERTEAQSSLLKARMAAARIPGGAAAHLHALYGLARATGTTDLTRATGKLPTHLGRLARTVLTDPELADTLLAPGPRPLEVAARDLDPAAPYADTDGRYDYEELEGYYGPRDGTVMRSIHNELRPTKAATERRLSHLLEDLTRRPLTAPAGHIDPAWPHLLDEAAHLARRVIREHEDEGYRPSRSGDFRDFADTAAHRARRLHATLIETDGRLDDELEALTQQALADPELLAATHIPAHPLTSHAPVPFAPALVDWLGVRAEQMSPALRHTLHADVTPHGFTGAFARLAATVAQHATAAQPATGTGRLPLPPQWQQHAELIGRLLDAAARNPHTVGLTVGNEPINNDLVRLVRTWIQEQVVDELDGADDTRETALVHAFFGDDAALDLLAVHVTAQTAQSARIALQPQDDTLYAVQRGHEGFVCRGAELHDRLGTDSGLRISWQGDGLWALWSREGGRSGTLQTVPAQEDAAPLPDAAVQEPDTGTPVRAEQAGEWALEILHPTPFPPGPEAVQAADQLLTDAGQWLTEHRALIKDVTPWHAQATEDALVDAAVSLPEPGENGGPAEHWRAMSEVHQHLLLLRAELTDKGEARPLHQALTQLTILLRHSDNYLNRAAARGMPELRQSTLRRAAGKNAYTSPQQAVAALASLQAAWREWAEEAGPIDQLPSAERRSVIALSALLNEPRPGATPAGWAALLGQVIDITRLRAEEVSDRRLGWQVLNSVATDMRQQWTATVAHEPDLAAAAARQSGILQLTRPDLAPANPPTSQKDFAARHNYLIRLAQRVMESGALTPDNSVAERTLLRLLEHLASEHGDLTDGVSQALPALCHQISELTRQVWHEQAEEGQFGYGDLLMNLDSTAELHAKRTQSLVDEADPQLRQEVEVLTEQARTDEQLLSTIHYHASSTAEVPLAPALWAWLEQREQDMSPRLRRALHSDIGPMGDFVGLFGTMWHALREAAPADAPAQLSPLPAAGTELPGEWQPWAEQVAALADAASSDIDLRLRLTGSLGDDAEDLTSRFTEAHLAAHQDVLPAHLIELYFGEDDAPTTAAEHLHTYLAREITARLDAATAPAAAAPGAPVPATALAVWHLEDPQGMGEAEGPYPDQAAARTGLLQLIASLGEFTRTWSGHQYVSEKALKEIADEAATALWQDATAEQLGTRPDAARWCVTLAELAHAFQLHLEEAEGIHESSISALASAAYEHAARMHVTTETLATTGEETWPSGAEDAEQQRTRALAQTIAEHLPASQLMRTAGSATWDETVTYTAAELYALALRTSAETPVWDNGVLTVTGSDSEPQIFTPVGETAGDTMRLARRRPISAPLEERGQAFEATITEPITIAAELDEAGAALNTLHKDAMRHLRTVLKDNEQITTFDQALPFIGGADNWHRQATQVKELAKAAARTRHAVEEAIGRHSRHHTTQPAHHALRLLEQAADRLADHLVPDGTSTTGETYLVRDMQQDQERITALAYLLDHLPFDDDMPADAGRDLQEALRLRDGHRDVGGLAGELHRHQKVAAAAKTLLNNSRNQRAFFALALHNLARHHVDRLGRHLLTLPTDGTFTDRAPAPGTPAADAIPVPRGAQSYAGATEGLAAQENLLELVRTAVLEGQRPLTTGHAPVVLAALMQAREHGIVYSDHRVLAAFAEQVRGQAHLNRLDKIDDASALKAAAQAAAKHAGNLVATERDADPHLRLALLELRRRAENDAELAAHTEPGADPQAARQAVAAWLYGTAWQHDLPAEQITLLTDVIARSGGDVLGEGPLAAWWKTLQATRPAAVTAALRSEFPGGTARRSITAFRNQRASLLDQIEQVLELEEVREKLAIPHTD
ncbi:helicase-related protein, partial [Streptomyces sp. NPDC059506]|uniref:helicase-related protein n=1 Tax=Streptomyces sp. NPDC059506 TaxID=3347751 RepID=UPI00368E16AD